MAFKLADSINKFLESKGLSTILKLLQFIPIPGVGAAAKTLETIKDAVVMDDDFSKLSDEDKKKFIELYVAESARLKNEDEAALKAEQIRLDDIANARAREIAIANSKKKDVMMKVTGAVGLLSFLFLVYAIIFVRIPVENKDIFNIVSGGIITVATGIFGYYFGSSKGSADKTDAMKQMS
jgi:hypothetical protein